MRHKRKLAPRAVTGIRFSTEKIYMHRTKDPRPAAAGKLHLILILGMLMALGPFSIDLYLPAFPGIARGLDTTVARVMLSLSSFFIGISAGQLVYGPLLERYGRKKPLYAGLLIYIAATAGCALAQSVDMLILLRLLQALGSCAGLVAARAMVRDLFEVKQNARVFSTLMLVVAVSPLVAPTVGGYLTAALGWRAVFAALILLGVGILVAVHYGLPESRPGDTRFSLKPAAILHNYKSILVHPQFYTYAFTSAVAAAGLYAYISGSPNVFMETYGLSEEQYGWVFACIALGLITATQINNRLLKTYRSERIIRFALAGQLFSGLLLLVILMAGVQHLFLTIGLLFCFLSCQGFIFPNASALSLAAFGHTAGSASALMGALQMGVGALASAAVSWLQNHTAVPMASVMTACAGLSLVIFLSGSQTLMRRASLEEVEEEEVDMMGTV